MVRGEKALALGIKDLRCAVGDHIAYFWETEKQFLAATGFLELGLRGGEHAVVFGHDDANAAVLRALEDRGQPVEDLRRAGRLSVLGGESDGDMLLSRIGATFQKAVEDGAGLIRLLGNIGWGRPDWPDEREILRFESKVTGAAATFPCVVVCMYDVNSVTGSALLHGAMGTHPLTIYHNMVRENPMCMDVDDFIRRLDALHEETEAA